MRIPNTMPAGELKLLRAGLFSPRRPTLDTTMLTIALCLSRRSTCRRRQVGCVLVDDLGRVLSVGYNGKPAGMEECTAVPCPGAEAASGEALESCHAIHAEQNALMFCQDIQKIATCYTTTSPCIHCVKMLLNTTCRRIIYMTEYSHPAARDLWLAKGRRWEHLDESP